MSARTGTTDQQIVSYLSFLSEKKKKAVLSVVKTFAEETLTLSDLMPDEVKKDVEKSLEQSKKGLGRAHSDVMKKYSRWLKK
jgi:hypothetical protein